jgi:large subunit ribosomal protein L24e
MECNFCGHEIAQGTGKMYVTKQGKTFYFCSNKCEKNLLVLKRKPRKVKWTDTYRAEKAIRIKS